MCAGRFGSVSLAQSCFFRGGGFGAVVFYLLVCLFYVHVFHSQIQGHGIISKIAGCED